MCAEHAPADQEWFVLTLQMPEEQIEPVQEWIRDTVSLEPVLIERRGADGKWIEVYFSSMAGAADAAQALSRAFSIQASSIRPLVPKDWQHFWRHHFKRREIGKNLLILPEWEADEESTDRQIIRLEPGLSFGTGDNFTTRFCLEIIDELFGRKRPERFLDVGAGSGILSIAAVKLGCPHVVALENDEVSLVSAQENLVRNAVESRVQLIRHDILNGWTGESFDFVCANIFSGVLRQAASVLSKVVVGPLVLSGIMEHEADEVAAAYLAQGGREIIRDGDGQWCGLVFEFS